MSNPAQASRLPLGGASGTAARSKWRERLILLVAGAALPVVIITVWQLLGNLGFIDTFFLPTPLMIAKAFEKLIVSGQLTFHLGISLRRAGIGFAIGGSLGLLLGIWTGLSRKLEDLVDPSVQLLRMIPHLAIAPLVILWFGFGETSKVVIIATGAFFPLYINTFLGIRSVENKLFEVARVLEFNRVEQVTKLILPASLPNILLGLRLSLAIAWLGLVVAELIGSNSGVGYLITFAQQNSQTEVIFVAVIIFAVIGKLIDSLVRYLDRRLLAWRDNYQG